MFSDKCQPSNQGLLNVVKSIQYQKTIFKCSGLCFYHIFKLSSSNVFLVFLNYLPQMLFMGYPFGNVFLFFFCHCIPNSQCVTYHSIFFNYLLNHIVSARNVHVWMVHPYFWLQVYLLILSISSVNLLYLLDIFKHEIIIINY